MTINLNELNNVQIEAVTNTQGPLLLLAGAGTGKTKTLTTRIAYILEKNLANPYEILAITFTNKASAEMKNRISEILNTPVQAWYVGTFHSICRRILTQHTAEIGYSPNFTILDSSDTSRLIKQILKDKNIDEKAIPPKLVASVISKWKNDFIEAENQIPSSDREATLIDIYKSYQFSLKRLNAMDFDDLILNVIKLFKNNKDVITSWQKRFKYVLVDEYQDTNVVQYLFLRLISAGYGNICCVGDDDQSIYSWRGAKIENILNFKKDYPEATILRLEENYRSTSNILNAANGLISHNSNRLGKNLWTKSEQGEKIRIKEFPDANFENRFLATEIEKLKIQGTNLSEIAILIRASWQSRGIEEKFLQHGINYKVIGSMKFYEREEIKDITSYLRLIYQQNDDLALLRIINKPARGIGQTSIDKLRAIATANSMSLFRAITETNITQLLRGKAGDSIMEFSNSILRFKEMQEEMSMQELTQAIAEKSGYLAMLRAENTEEAKGRIENIEELISSIKDFENLEEFIEYISLITDEDDNSETANQSFVSIMTIHRAKGLEFDNVFLPGWEEGVFPSSRTIDENTESGEEEERRLAYVAITRAKKHLTISNAKSRFIFGENNIGVTSRFIREIPEEYRILEKTNIPNQFSSDNARNIFNELNLHNNHKSEPKDYYQDETTERSTKFKIGEPVRHALYGEGKVVDTSNTTLIIQFKNGARKSIAASFLKKV